MSTVQTLTCTKYSTASPTSMICGLSAWRPSSARWARSRRSACFTMSASRPRPHAVDLACRLRDVHRLRDLGNAFHCHAGVFARHSTAYNIALTGLSLVVAIVLTGLGLAVAIMPPPATAAPGWAAPWSAAASRRCTTPAWRRSKSRGGLFGIRCWWRCRLRSAGVIGAVALPIGLHKRFAQMRDSSARCLLTAAICSLHFTGMGAASIIPDPTIQVSASALPAGISRRRGGARELYRRCACARRRHASRCANGGGELGS